MTQKADVGALLAGGRGRRMGGRDKAALSLNNRLLSDIALEQLGYATQHIVTAAPTRPAWLAGRSELAFVSDQVDLEGEAIGPAGGLLASLLWAHDRAGRNALVFTMPVDAPFTPPDLCEKLMVRLGDAPAAIASNHGRLHPIFGIWRARMAMEIHDLVMDHGLRALKGICTQIDARIVDIDAPESAFANINTPEDLEAAQDLVLKGL